MLVLGSDIALLVTESLLGSNVRKLWLIAVPLPLDDVAADNLWVLVTAATMSSVLLEFGWNESGRGSPASSAVPAPVLCAASASCNGNGMISALEPLLFFYKKNVSKICINIKSYGCRHG